MVYQLCAGKSMQALELKRCGAEAIIATQR